MTEPNASEARPAHGERDERSDITLEELQLAARNHGMPLEALRHDLTPAGLHYLLVHYDIPLVEVDSWRLRLEGAVDRPLSLSLEELRARPAVTRPVTMECAGNGRARLSPRPISQPWLLEAVGTGEWTGTPLAPLLEEAGLLEGSLEVVFTGLDRGYEGGVEQRYARSLSVADALGEEALLVYELGGLPLPIQHGFPLRLVVPGWYGMTNVKWLERVKVVTEPFEGYQQAVSYRIRRSEDEPGAPVTRMLPRSLMVPPGVPDFKTRERFVGLGGCELEGRAWSGWSSVERVELSSDGGSTWQAAELEEAPAPGAWQRWTCRWRPSGPGRFELISRARDGAGNEQPLDAPWNVGGYANNEVQRVVVQVVDRPPDPGTGAAPE